MKTGVSTTPCAVASRPRRATPSVARISKRSELTRWTWSSLDHHGVAVRSLGGGLPPPFRTSPLRWRRRSRRSNGRETSFDEHRVAVGVEAVAGVDGGAARAEDGLPAGGGGEQQQHPRGRQG